MTKDGLEELHSEENVNAGLIGSAVDYLSRMLLGVDKVKAFHVCLFGAKKINLLREALVLHNGINGLDDQSIINAIKLAGFDVAFRASPLAYVPIEEINPNEKTINNVRLMTKRVLNFLDMYGPIIKEGFTFEDGGYTPTIMSGDGDILTEDTVWDIKTIRGNLNKNHTLQLFIYWRMGLKAMPEYFKSVRYLGVFNPRKNLIRRYPTTDIPKVTIEKVESEVIMYQRLTFG